MWGRRNGSTTTNITFTQPFSNEKILFFVCYQMMSKSDFLQSLMNFQKDSITDETVELLAPYLDAEDFNIETAKRVRRKDV
jgi:hypothetical protein